MSDFKNYYVRQNLKGEQKICSPFSLPILIYSFNFFIASAAFAALKTALPATKISAP